jgi:hypothetical protein
MPNKSNRIRNHFKKCNNFKNKYPQQYIEYFESELEVENELISISKKRLRRESTSSTYSSTSRASMYLFKLFKNLYKFIY